MTSASPTSPAARTPGRSRLHKAFARAGIRLRFESGVYHVENDQAQAKILLPASLPLEEKAVTQLLNFAAVRAPDGPLGLRQGVRCACATPDFHPGSIAPVGAVVATDADFAIPAAIGTDINCGMRLVRTGLTLAQASFLKDRLLARLQAVLLQNQRDLPMHGAAFAALFDAGPAACIDRLPSAGLWARIDRTRVQQETARCIGLAEIPSDARHAPEALTRVSGQHELLRPPSLGTPGGGNHFVELQILDRIEDRHAAYAAGLRAGEVVVMIHSGSRDVGFYVGGRWMDQARAAWPAGHKHPASGLYGLSGDLAAQYLRAMGVAARYAWLNRVALDEMVRQVLAELGGADCALVVDVPHNVILPEQGMNIHRKGATPARSGDLALIPGSMGDHSWVAMGQGLGEWLWSCSHGAGRSVRRQAMRAKPLADASRADAPLDWECVTLREERRIEEAPGAYKPIGPVMAAQQAAGLIRPVARLRPWVTFKA